VIEDGPEALLTLPQGLFRLLAGRDVPSDAQEQAFPLALERQAFALDNDFYSILTVQEKFQRS
jgi:hypothetical protein